MFTYLHYLHRFFLHVCIYSWSTVWLIENSIKAATAFCYMINWSCVYIFCIWSYTWGKQVKACTIFRTVKHLNFITENTFKKKGGMMECRFHFSPVRCCEPALWIRYICNDSSSFHWLVHSLIPLFIISLYSFLSPKCVHLASLYLYHICLDVITALLDKTVH